MEQRRFGFGRGAIVQNAFCRPDTPPTLTVPPKAPVLVDVVPEQSVAAAQDEMVLAQSSNAQSENKKLSFLERLKSMKFRCVVFSI
jgi:hypothetical protein